MELPRAAHTGERDSEGAEAPTGRRNGAATRGSDQRKRNPWTPFPKILRSPERATQVDTPKYRASRLHTPDHRNLDSATNFRPLRTSTVALAEYVSVRPGPSSLGFRFWCIDHRSVHDFFVDTYLAECVNLRESQSAALAVSCCESDVPPARMSATSVASGPIASTSSFTFQGSSSSMRLIG